jgi:hypothetical protein
MLPTQSGFPRGIAFAEPHKRLMAAVLQAVLDDCHERVASRQLAALGPEAATRAVRTAIAYIASGDRAWPYSFENVCEALGLDPQCLRAKLDIEREDVAA